MTHSWTKIYIPTKWYSLYSVTYSIFYETTSQCLCKTRFETPNQQPRQKTEEDCAKGYQTWTHNPRMTGNWNSCKILPHLGPVCSELTEFWPILDTFSRWLLGRMLNWKIWIGRKAKLGRNLANLKFSVKGS